MKIVEINGRKQGEEENETLQEYMVYSSCSVIATAYATQMVEAYTAADAEDIAEFDAQDFEIDWDTSEIDFDSEDVYDVEEY